MYTCDTIGHHIIILHTHTHTHTKSKPIGNISISNGFFFFFFFFYLFLFFFADILLLLHPVHRLSACVHIAVGGTCESWAACAPASSHRHHHQFPKEMRLSPDRCIHVYVYVRVRRTSMMKRRGEERREEQRGNKQSRFSDSFTSCDHDSTAAFPWLDSPLQYAAAAGAWVCLVCMYLYLDTSSLWG